MSDELDYLVRFRDQLKKSLGMMEELADQVRDLSHLSIILSFVSVVFSTMALIVNALS